MNKKKLFYFIVATVLIFLMFSFWGVTGEGGIATYYITTALTLPVGLLFGWLFEMLSKVLINEVAGLLSLAIIAMANYFQWVFFISLYRKWKSNIAKDK